MRLAAIYIFFAILSTGINLSTQWPVFYLFEGWWVIYLALAVGTSAGLITKYLLDKKWIFKYQHTSKQDNIEKFGLYTLMGVVTTIIFWGTEMLFFYAFTFEGAQYVGGALGLAVGYLVKYQLDKKFVFRVTR